MKKTILGFMFLGILFSIIFSPVSAESNDLGKELEERINKIVGEATENGATPSELRKQIRKEVNEQKKEFLEEMKNKRKEILEQTKEKKKNILDEIKDKLKSMRFGARITGNLKLIEGNSLTITAGEGKIYTVNVTDNTKLRRKFWGDTKLSEFSVNDKLHVVGKWTDDAKTKIDAYLIRNLSIQKRWGVFFGTVTQTNSDNLVLETSSRGKQTVYFGTAKLVNRKNEGIKIDEIQTGHKIRAKGVWDSANDKIIEVTHIMDFSLPTIPVKNPTSTLTPTPTVTTTLTPTPTGVM